MYEELDNTTFVPLVCVDQEYLGRYEINKLGQIRIIGTTKILTVITKIVDYPKVILRSQGNTIHKLYFVHLLIAKTFIQNPDPLTKTQVNHINRDRFDYSLGNLEWVSPTENLKARGELKSWNRLTYVKLDDSGNELERFPRENLSQYERNRISSAIPKKERYQGHFWKIVDSEVEAYYARFSPEERSKEEWREALGYPGIYISNLGLVRTTRGVTVGHLIDSGYRTVNLKPHRRIHSLVAETFILGRPLVKPEVVDHINCDKELNAVWNLRVCKDQKENLANPLTKQKDCKRVGKYDFQGNLLKEYESTLEAIRELGLSEKHSNISSCCKEKRLKSKGYLWAYQDGTQDEVIKRKLDLLAKRKNKK